MDHTFDTLAEAIAAGYTRGHTLMYRGFCIHPVDVSGPHSFGYRYAVEVDTDRYDRLDLESLSVGFSDLIGLCHDEHGRDLQYARSVTVWLHKELNQVHQPGAFCVRFTPEGWERGVNLAKAAIDKWMDARPDVAARQAEVERQDEEQRQQAARRWTERQAQRSERRPLVHLVQLWDADGGTRVVPSASLDNARREHPHATQLAVFTFC